MVGEPFWGGRVLFARPLPEDADLSVEWLVGVTDALDRWLVQREIDEERERLLSERWLVIPAG